MVKNILWNPNTKYIQLLLTCYFRAYVSYNEKNLHVWKAENEEQIF